MKAQNKYALIAQLYSEVLLVMTKFLLYMYIFAS